MGNTGLMSFFLNKSKKLIEEKVFVQSLKNHYSYYVSKEVEKLNNSNQAVEYQLDEAFENNSYESVSIIAQNKI